MRWDCGITCLRRRRLCHRLRCRRRLRPRFRPRRGENREGYCDVQHQHRLIVNVPVSVAAVSVTASAAAAACALDSDLAAASTVMATWGAAGATYQCPGPCMPHTSSVVPAAAAAALRVGLAVQAAAAEPPNPAVAVLVGAAKCVQSDVLPHIKPPKYR